VKEIAAKDPQAVVMISAYKSCGAFIKEMKKAGSNPQFMNVSFVGSKALAAELGDLAGGVIISQVVPYYADPSYEVAYEFQAALEKRFPGHKASFNNLEGYIAAKAFVEGLRRAGRDLTRDNLIAALESFRREDFGGVHLTFSPTNHNGSDKVLLTIIVNGRGSFAPFWSEALTAGR
jgi:ABC-type branched-subunit amino acid transport system substrate-binding protein